MLAFGSNDEVYPSLGDIHSCSWIAVRKNAMWTLVGLAVITMAIVMASVWAYRRHSMARRLSVMEYIGENKFAVLANQAQAR
jgi:hypothetical protein